jgi:hypothetical protein
MASAAAYLCCQTPEASVGDLLLELRILKSVGVADAAFFNALASGNRAIVCLEQRYRSFPGYPYRCIASQTYSLIEGNPWFSILVRMRGQEKTCTVRYWPVSDREPKGSSRP